MKAPPLEYLRATSVSEAVAALADEDAKVLAGGQSLIPLLALRLARPTVLVDIAELGLDDLAVVAAPHWPSGQELRIGATVRQRRLELDPVVAGAVPLLADAVREVGYPSTRNRGTLGGSLAHADPVAELPAVAVALGGTLRVAGPAGARSLRCEDLSDGFFTTTLAPDEILTEIRLPTATARHGAAWCEWAARAHDFAEAGIGVALDLDAAGMCVGVAAAACGLGGGPLPLGAVLAAAGIAGAVRGPEGPAPSLLRAAAAAVVAACPSGDDDRVALAGLLTARAVVLAWERAVAGPAGRAAA
jgi:carbon-monoxide dehydrogenase medium subunit